MESMGALVVLAYLGVLVLVIVSIWKIFEKAGKPGWAAIVPIYNMIVLLEIVKKPVWWIVLMMIPFVNIVIAIIVYVELAKSFGKSAGFGIGMIFLSFIFLPLLAFGEDQYLDAAASSSGGALDSDLV
jgi:hypothetical protein